MESLEIILWASFMFQEPSNLPLLNLGHVSMLSIRGDLVSRSIAKRSTSLWQDHLCDLDHLKRSRSFKWSWSFSQKISDLPYLCLHHFIDVYLDGVKIDVYIDESAEMSM